MITTDNKYVVFKREGFFEFVERLRDEPPHQHAQILSTLPDYALKDAVVIRLRDSFASPALHAYANCIATSARAIGELAPSTRDRLLSIADYFHTRAVEADEIVSKLPD